MLNIKFIKYLFFILIITCNISDCVYVAELITNTAMSLTEIAYESGFGSVRSFNRAFRGLYGITPGEYREK